MVLNVTIEIIDRSLYDTDLYFMTTMIKGRDHPYDDYCSTWFGPAT